MKYLLPLVFALSMLLTSCMVKAPEWSYYDEPKVQQQRKDTYRQLLELLPESQRSLPAAQEEAAWLVEHGFKAAISISRYNNPIGLGFQNNRNVNSPQHIRERGLCWHYQADMFRELRRRHLNYFYIGFCRRDDDTSADHNCVYIRAAGGQWPDAILMDPWVGSGRLNVMNRRDILIEHWHDSPFFRARLDGVYTENHRFPMEHWESVQSDEHPGHYVSVFTREGRTSRQGQLMFANMARGLKERNGKLTDY